MKRFSTLIVLSCMTLSVIGLHAISGQEYRPAQAFGGFPECADGLDNDDDGLVDYPEDTGCRGLEDRTEGPTGGLFVSLSDGLDKIDAGNSLTYTIGLSNDQPEQKIVNVRLLIPHQTNVLSASNGGHIHSPYITWTGVALEPFQPRELYVSVQVTPNAEIGYVLASEVTADGKKAADTTRVIAASDSTSGSRKPHIKLTVSDGKTYVQPGEINSYILTAQNTSRTPQQTTIHTTLPPELNFLYATSGHTRSNRNLSWNDITIAPGETLQFEIRGYVEHDAADFDVIQLRIAAGAAQARDTTSIHRNALPPTGGSINLSVNDGFQEAVPGDMLTYEIHLQNNTPNLGTEIDINNAIPSYTEFVSATEGGYWTGKNVRWEGLTVSPHGDRRLHVTARVRSDAPLGTRLANRVSAEGQHAVDETVISGTSVGAGVSQAGRQVVLSKRADRSEVRPGDTVNYTVTLRNNGHLPLHNVLVEDRMDTRYMQIVSGDRGTLDGDRIIWKVSHVAPGETWETRYAVRIHPGTPHGSELKNIVTARGNGMEQVSLTERVMSVNLGVISTLPPTGAPIDAIALGIIGLAGAFQTIGTKRKLLAVSL